MPQTLIEKIVQKHTQRLESDQTIQSGNYIKRIITSE